MKITMRKWSPAVGWVGMVVFTIMLQSVTGFAVTAPKPLFRDPVHDGAADPTLIYNRARHVWWMFYTNRRADLADANEKDVAWVHNTKIGVAESRDGGNTWKYHGTAKLPYGAADYTFWAPEIVDAEGTYHMYVTVVPGTFHDWNAAREIVHMTSKDLEHWKVAAKLELGSDRVIDSCVLRLPNGGWRMWFKDERDHSHIHYADSPDLYKWTVKGTAVSDRSSEAPKVFQWKGHFWMIVDAWHGLGVYRSDDLEHWDRQPANILETPGKLATDRSIGHHCDVVLNKGRAYLFYFTHQMGADEVAELKNSADRTVIQVAELDVQDGWLKVDRDQPVTATLGVGADQDK